jgi:erythromycin esterase-like protein
VRSRDDAAIEEIRAGSSPLRAHADLDRLLDRIDDARLVLLGEASHGTSEYYTWRAALTKRLIVERGFDLVAVEGDWPDCFEVNRWVKGRGDQDLTPLQVLAGFERWPTWMWGNEEVADFAGWLRAHNAATGAGVGFYGLDVYSLWESLRVVLGYLRDRHPDALEAAEAAWRCFEPYGEDPHRYARATRLVPESCEDEVIELLLDLHRGRGTGDDDPEGDLDAAQNAEVVAGAERYYRTMAWADAGSWNVRDCHMTDTLDRLLAHHGPAGKAVVWEHNTHVGDARATDMASHGMVNVGQLARERHEADGVVLVGFGGHRGSVVAGDNWGAPMRRMPVPPAPTGTHEDLLHRAVGAPSLFVFGDDRTTPWLGQRRGHRAIGVVYRPDHDQWGNWVPTVLGRRYDAFLSFDETSALRPLGRPTAAVGGERDTEPWAS